MSQTQEALKESPLDSRNLAELESSIRKLAEQYKKANIEIAQKVVGEKNLDNARIIVGDSLDNIFYSLLPNTSLFDSQPRKLIKVVSKNRTNWDLEELEANLSNLNNIYGVDLKIIPDDIVDYIFYIEISSSSNEGVSNDVRDTVLGNEKAIDGILRSN